MKNIKRLMENIKRLPNSCKETSLIKVFIRSSIHPNKFLICMKY